ncbi:flavodoxin family protein [Gehongia tenuis]|uniref:Flavodoxin family protein n=1 Tax=Gehongia tenuis TaxID=2763655 RepID=A0A926D309_9FIRM|nr:flavodoxin family protein [Gehongia tenuis]MBC8530353.1 flavodoxin family protein [Gehongia tenuis]
MAILVLWASPNKDGLTAAAKDRIVAGIAGAGGEAKVLHLNGMRVDRCLACGNGWGRCKAEGRCVLPDDFGQIYDELRAADGIVWVTPVYWHDLAESLKSLLDRLRRCETAHNHGLRGKECLLVACAGGSGRGAVSCLSRLEETLGHMDMTAVDRLPVIQFNRGYMLPALESAGKAFASRIRERTQNV